MEEIKKDTAQKSQTEELKEKYGKVYRVGATIEVDDETEKNVEFFFKRPSTASYDRYVKTTAQGATKALKVFLFDNVVEESRVSLEATLRSSRPWRSPSVRSCSGCWASPNRQI